MAATVRAESRAAESTDGREIVCVLSDVATGFIAFREVPQEKADKIKKPTITYFMRLFFSGVPEASFCTFRNIQRF